MSWLRSYSENMRLQDKFNDKKISLFKINKVIELAIQLENLKEVRIIQDCNIGGEYWRLFCWFGEDRYCAIIRTKDSNLPSMRDWDEIVPLIIGDNKFNIKKNRDYDWNIILNNN